MQELEALINQLDPSTVVELGIDDPVDAWARRLSSEDRRVLGLGAEAGSAYDIDGITVLVADLDQPLDLIVDHSNDDSERLRTAFEALFPLITPGGMYVIEGAVPPHFILELMFCTIASGDLVARVMTGHMWVAVDRGVEALDGRHFRLADGYKDPFNAIR